MSMSAIVSAEIEQANKIHLNLHPKNSNGPLYDSGIQPEKDCNQYMYTIDPLLTTPLTANSIYYSA